MRLVQSVRDGDLSLEDTSRPIPSVAQVTVRTRRSLISSGTEKSVRSLASSSLLAKARSRPDLVREVVRRAQTQGVAATARQVKGRLSDNMPLGYSAAGTVLEVGEAVANIRPGQRVATAGAPHADFQLASGNLVVPLPDTVSFEEGSFVTVASIALNGLRLAEAEAGTRILVVGLGLVGQLALRMAAASGCDVSGIDPVIWKQDIAQKVGAAVFGADEDGWTHAIERTGGSGFDAVIVAAATSSSDPMLRAAEAARDRGLVVLVGDTGLNLDRRSLYEKELAVRVARSYGPGRYDPNYENLGVDYPIGGMRWTAQRNMEAVVGLLASKRLEVADLITHRFAFEDALEAYGVLDDEAARYLGIVLEYQGENGGEAGVELASSSRRSRVDTRSGAGLIGAGRFARGVLLPAAQAAGFDSWTVVASSGGASAVNVGEESGFERAVSNGDAVIADSDTGVVFVATRHDTHARFVRETLTAGKHVFCEKPLAITQAELDDVVAAYNDSGNALMVGFNRRWSPAVRKAKAFLGSRPTQMLYRIHAGSLPDDHWLKDRRQGGRLLGEACHFIDTCNAIAGEAPRFVFAAGSGEGELLLQDDFTITLSYPSGSQATIVYSGGAPRGAGKERLEMVSGDKSAVIDDYRILTLADASSVNTTKYKPADKGHDTEFVIFREAIEGRRDRDELAETAITTSRVALAAVESLMTGTAVRM